MKSPAPSGLIDRLGPAGVRLAAAAVVVLTVAVVPAQTYRVTRLHSAPILDDGGQTNGPSVIRVPDWIPQGSRPWTVVGGSIVRARYYLYYGDHNGDHIRMAWSDSITSPTWRRFNTTPGDDLGPGSGDLVPGRGVLDMDLGGDDDHIQLTPGLHIGDVVSSSGGLLKAGHIASPDVHVDEARRRVVMYFHGASNGRYLFNGSQRFTTQNSFVATSSDGLNFNMPQEGGQPGHGVRPITLGRSYYRVFEHLGRLHSLSRSGTVNRAPIGDPWSLPAGAGATDAAWDSLTEQTDTEFDRDLDRRFPGKADGDLYPRHFAVSRTGDLLEVFYSVKAVGSHPDGPERILRSTIDLSTGDWSSWRPVLPPEDVLAPGPAWEGGALIDPCVFVDADGRKYLFYSCGSGGEGKLGVARLDPPSRPATYGRFGDGCVGSSGVAPVLWSADLPWLGETFTAIAVSIPAGVPVHGLLGLARRSPPLDLGAIGMPGCLLHTDPLDVMPLSNAGGMATWSLAIPGQVSLVGFRFQQQLFVTDPGANRFGAVVSNAQEGTVGLR